MDEPYHHTPYPKPVRPVVMPGSEKYFQYQTLVHVVHGVTIGYRLTLKGVPDVETMPSTRDESLPEYSIGVTLGDHEVVLTVDEWGGRGEELDTWLRDWIGRVTLYRYLDAERDMPVAVLLGLSRELGIGADVLMTRAEKRAGWDPQGASDSE